MTYLSPSPQISNVEGLRAAEVASDRLVMLAVVRQASEVYQRLFHRGNDPHELLVTWFAYRLARQGGFLNTVLTAEQVLWAGVLHDIGKNAIDDRIVNKPGPLSQSERYVIQSHPLLGRQIAEGVPEVDNVVLDGILYHHERYDGAGYPVGLIGEGIPLLARILTVADVYAALTSGRPYRPAWEPAEAVKYLRDHKGKIFDPVLVDLFLDNETTAH